MTSKLVNSKDNGLYDKIAAMNKRIVNDIFDRQGGVYGVKEWPRLDPKNIGKKRYSSYGNLVGRYTAGSLPLQASKRFKRSHVKLAEGNKKMVFGSNFEDNRVTNIINAGRGQRQTMPDVNSAQYQAELSKVIEDHTNDLIKDII